MELEKMEALANQLLASGRDGKLRWKEGLVRDSYRLYFPDVAIGISHPIGSTFILQIIDDEGETIGSFAPEPDTPQHKVLREVHKNARRNIQEEEAVVNRNIDKALEYLRRA